MFYLLKSKLIAMQSGAGQGVDDAGGRHAREAAFARVTSITHSTEGCCDERSSGPFMGDLRHARA